MTKLPTASELKNAAPGQDWRNHMGSVYSAMKQHYAAMQSIDANCRMESREMRASEQRAYDAHSQQWDALNAIHERIEAQHPESRQPVSRAGVVAPGSSPFDQVGGTRDTLPFLNRGESLASWASARGAREFDQDEPVRMGAMIQSWITGDRSRLNGTEIRNMAEGTASAGGVMVPTPTAAKFIDRARNASRVLEAGAVTVPMDTQTLKVPRLTGSSAPAWRAENAAIAVGDLTMDAVTLTAQSMAFMVKISRELIEDTSDPNILAVIEQDLAAQVALEIDRVALRGTGTSPEPRGVKNTSGVTTLAFGGANGAAPANYDHLIDAVQAVRANNFEPNAFIYSPRSATTLAKMKDTTGQYLTPPASLDDMQKLTTNQIPGNLTTGTSTDTSEIYTGLWPMLYLGIRTGPLMIQLVERYADLGQIALLVWFRGDVAVAQPGAFAVTTGVRP